MSSKFWLPLVQWCCEFYKLIAVSFIPTFAAMLWITVIITPMQVVTLSVVVTEILRAVPSLSVTEISTVTVVARCMNQRLSSKPFLNSRKHHWHARF